MLEIYNLHSSAELSESDLIVAAMKWHFSEASGCNFWLQKREELPFDPLTDIRSISDLDLFPDFAEDLKTARIDDLIPKALWSERSGFSVFESGGTTGRPSRILERQSRLTGLDFVNSELVKHGISMNFPGHWLHIGPTGPHIVGRSIGRLANQRNSNCFYVDFDPRWVKKLIREGESAHIKKYAAHVLNQARDVLETQNISVVFITPPILELVCQDESLLDLFKTKVKAVIWAGTSISDDALSLIEQEYLPEQILVGLYGNTLMGIAPQRVKHPNDTFPCVFQPFYPYTLVSVVEKDNPVMQVPYGSRGVVKINLLTPECFIPNHLERDEATRIAPVAGYRGDGVSGIAPPSAVKNNTVEGIY